MNQFVVITVQQKALSKAINEILKFSGHKSQSPIINIKAYDNCIELSVQGAMIKISAKVEGTSNIAVPSKLILAYLQTSSMQEISFRFTAGQLECGSSIYSTNAIELMPIEVEINSELAINYNRPSILRLADTHTPEEIDAKGLTNVVRIAKIKFKNNIQEVAEILKDYEITYDEIEAFVFSKIK